jgi:peptide/nickel transport system permease protein
MSRNSVMLNSTFKFAGREFSITLFLLILVIGLTSWMRVSRIVRASVLSIKEQEYITAARAIGSKNLRIVATFTDCMGRHRAATWRRQRDPPGSLSCLGLGVRPPTPGAT